MKNLLLFHKIDSGYHVFLPTFFLGISLGVLGYQAKTTEENREVVQKLCSLKRAGYPLVRHTRLQLFHLHLLFLLLFQICSVYVHKMRAVPTATSAMTTTTTPTTDYVCTLAHLTMASCVYVCVCVFVCVSVYWQQPEPPLGEASPTQQAMRVKRIICQYVRSFRICSASTAVASCQSPVQPSSTSSQDCNRTSPSPLVKPAPMAVRACLCLCLCLRLCRCRRCRRRAHKFFVPAAY